MSRIVIAGAGSVGASIAYHLALLGARDVVLCDRAEIASGATGKAMGGFRQQFSTEAEVRLAQESAKLFRELRAPRAVAPDFLVTAGGASPGDLGPPLPIRPLCRQLVDVGPVADLPA